MPAKEIVIDYERIQSFDSSPLDRVKNYTKIQYSGYMMKKSGAEHYPLLSYISATYGDCRHLVDIGTRVATSALALGSNQRSPVWTFDIPKSMERRGAFRGRTEEEWQKNVHDLGVDITFYNIDLLNTTDEELKTYLGTWFVLLDTFHEPDRRPFEREFFQRMIDIGFKGMLLLDDIYLNTQMKKWWSELRDNTSKFGYTTHDVTKVGHATGTGLVDFSGKVIIKQS